MPRIWDCYVRSIEFRLRLTSRPRICQSSGAVQRILAPPECDVSSPTSGGRMQPYRQLFIRGAGAEAPGCKLTSVTIHIRTLAVERIVWKNRPNGKALGNVGQSLSEAVLIAMGIKSQPYCSNQWSSLNFPLPHPTAQYKSIMFQPEICLCCKVSIQHILIFPSEHKRINFRAKHKFHTPCTTEL